MKFHDEDNDNCRVYYREDRKLYCWQLDRPGEFLFFRCSSDGEPSHEVTPRAVTPRPPGETSIGRELIAYLDLHGL